MADTHAAAFLLHDYLGVSAARLPHKIALVCTKQRVTYGELERRSNALAGTLVRYGVQRGDRVMVFADNTVEAVVAFWAVLKASAVVSVVNPLTKADKLAYLIDDCRPSALVTDAHLHKAWARAASSKRLKAVIVSGNPCGETLAEVPTAVKWEDALAMGDPTRAPVRQSIDADLAAIIYTSGSTGKPKGVMLTHRNMLAAATSVAAYLGIREDDIILGALPLSFDYGLYQMIMAFREGARLVLERSFAFPAQVLALMIEEGATVFPGMPTMFALLARLKSLNDFDLSKVRCVTSTAAPLAPKYLPLLRGLFPSARIYSMYGLTECKRCTYLPPEDLDRKPSSVGLPIPGTELWIVDDRGNKVGADTVGELVVRGATVMQGYWDKPGATAERLRPGPLPGERVLYTGDYCKLDREGYLYFVGRMDDIIKCRGEKVAPREVEGVIADIPGVDEVAVVGEPDEILGEAVKAFVVLERRASVTARDIQRACLEKLENFMVPKVVEIVLELPRTDTGKVRKAALS